MLLIRWPSWHLIGVKQHLSSQLQGSKKRLLYEVSDRCGFAGRLPGKKSTFARVAWLTNGRTFLSTELPSPCEAKAEGPEMPAPRGSNGSEGRVSQCRGVSGKRGELWEQALSVRAKVITKVTLISQLWLCQVGRMSMIRYSYPL